MAGQPARPKQLIGRGFGRGSGQPEACSGAERKAPREASWPKAEPPCLLHRSPTRFIEADHPTHHVLTTHHSPLTTHHLLWLYLLGAPSVAFIDDTNATHPNVTLVKATVAFGTFRGQVRASQPVSKSASSQVSN